MKEIANTIEQAKKYAIFFVDVPPHAEFEIRWAADSPPIGEVIPRHQEMGGLFKSSGPMLIACLTD